MNSSRAFAYFGSFICSSISSHTFCHLGFSFTSCSISKHNARQLFKPFAVETYIKNIKKKRGIKIDSDKTR